MESFIFCTVQYPRDYNLLIVQDLQQVHYRNLLIILLEDFIKWNVNMNTITKNVKLSEIINNIVSAFSNTPTVKIIIQMLILLHELSY